MQHESYTRRDGDPHLSRLPVMIFASTIAIVVAYIAVVGFLIEYSNLGSPLISVSAEQPERPIAVNRPSVM